jgi:hypothetical protein
VVDYFLHNEVIRLDVLRRRYDRLVALESSVRAYGYRIIFNAMIITILINHVFYRALQIEVVVFVVGVAVIYEIRDVVRRLR